MAIDITGYHRFDIGNVRPHVKALYYNALPLDYNARKTAAPDKNTIMGANVYASGLFPALLRHSSFDRIYLPDYPAAAKREILDLPYLVGNGERIIFLPEHSIQELREVDSLVFLSPGQHIRPLARLREKAGLHESPVTGVVHSLNYGAFQENLLLDMLSPLHTHDALFVSSTAGLTVLRRQIENVTSQMSVISSAIRFQPQLLRIPLAIDETQHIPETLSWRRNEKVTRGIDPDATVVLYLGRLSSTSKADLFPLLAVFAHLSSIRSNVRLVIAGDDSHTHIRGDLAAFARELKCSDCVSIFSDVPHQEKLQLLKLADIFVSPSDCIQETFGITLLEAMASGLPVIASDWNGYRDIVEDRVTGILVPTMMPRYARDFDSLLSSGSMIADDMLARTTVVDVGQLLKALLAVIDDPVYRLDLGNAGRAKVMRDYTWSKVISSYESTWNQLRLESSTTSRIAGSNNFTLNTGFSYSEIYEHYATSPLSAEDLVIPGPFIGHTTDGFLEVVAASRSRFDMGLLKELLNVLRATSPMSVVQLIDQVKSSDTPHPSNVTIETAVFIHIARLIKYGCIQKLGSSKNVDRTPLVSRAH